MPPVGLRAGPSHAMALPSRRQSFGMGCASGMAGLRLGCPAPACTCVSSPSLSHTLCHAHSAGFPQSAILASSLKRVAHNVSVEPHLQPITSERFHLRSASTEYQARLDVVASGVWGGRFERTFLDVKVFNPYAPSNRTSSLPVCYHRHEQEKRQRYDRRIREMSGLHFCRLFSLLPEAAARMQLRC